ncbi:MAG: hypothetical protein AAFY11_14710, partial [Cyanobacteria bacterium J06641_5]
PQDNTDFDFDFDMDISTAARLSATFPYVSPVCRADSDQEQDIHLADGGIAENFGVFSALEWLSSQEEMLEEYGVEKVMLLKINSFPEEQPNERPNSLKNGWIASLLGPILAAINVRDHAQLAAAEQACKASRKENPNLFESYEIFFSSDKTPPLSWKLTPEEKNSIEDSWIAQGMSIVSRVKKFLD